MPPVKTPRTRPQREGSQRARAIERELAEAVRTARQDAGLSQRELARAAGVSHDTIRAIEDDAGHASLPVLARVMTVLGGRLNVYVRWGVGPLIRDHIQAAMMSGCLGEVNEDWWRKWLEVTIKDPVQGSIDAVLRSRRDDWWVALEAQSRLERLEQQIRWSNAKKEGLASMRPPDQADHTSRLLLLHSTARNRSVVAQHADLLALAYPARIADAVAALRGEHAWPGAAIVWCSVEGGVAALLDGPPRGIRLGR